MVGAAAWAALPMGYPRDGTPAEENPQLYPQPGATCSNFLLLYRCSLSMQHSRIQSQMKEPCKAGGEVRAATGG